MFTGTEFLIGIGVLVVISAIGSVFMFRRKDEPWEHDINQKKYDWDDGHPLDLKNNIESHNTIYDDFVL